MAHFIITTNREVAEKVEAFSKSKVLNKNRSCKVDKVTHDTGFSTIKICSTEDGGLIKPEDIFWLAHYSAGMEILIKT